MSALAPTGTGNHSNATAGAAGSITVNKPANLADGDVLVAWVYYRNSATTFTAPSGWTPAVSQTTGQSEGVWTKPIPTAASEPSTYTWSFTGGSARTGVIVQRVTGADLGDPVDAVGAFVAGITSSAALPAVTAVDGHALLLEFVLAQTSTTTPSTITAPGTSTTLTQVSFDNGSAASTLWMGSESLSASGSTGTRTAGISPNASNGNGVMITIKPASSPAPVAAITSLTASALTVSADGSGSSATSPATVTGYSWDWGDSSTDSTGATPTHNYDTPGTYTVTLTVTDSNGSTDTATQDVTVYTPTTSVKFARLTVVDGWTASAGDALSCLTDGDNSTFITSSANPSGLDLEGQLRPMVPPLPGQPLKLKLGIDVEDATSGSVDAQVFEGATQRSELTSIPLTVESGTSVTASAVLEFPWTDMSAVTSGGWDDGLIVKLQVTTVS